MEGYKITHNKISKDGLVIKYETAEFCGDYLYLFVYDLDVATIKFGQKVTKLFQNWKDTNEY